MNAVRTDIAKWLSDLLYVINLGLTSLLAPASDLQGKWNSGQGELRTEQLPWSHMGGSL